MNRFFLAALFACDLAFAVFHHDEFDKWLAVAAITFGVWNAIGLVCDFIDERERKRRDDAAIRISYALRDVPRRSR